MNVKENLDLNNMERKVPSNRGRKKQSIFKTKAIFKEGRGGSSIDEDDLNSAFGVENFNKLKVEFNAAPTDEKDYFIGELNKIEPDLGDAFNGTD